MGVNGFDYVYDVGEASRRRRIVVKEPATPITAEDNNLALAA